MSESNPNQVSEWQVPPHAANDDRKLSWLNDATEEGNKWLKSQRGYGDFKKALDTISGRINDAVPQYRSQLNSNRLKRNVREVVGTLAKLRPMWGYHSDNKAFAEQTMMLNKMVKALYLERFFDRSIKDALQFAAATCTGWIRPVYRREMYGTGKGDISLLAYGSPCVLPTQLPANGDWQSAYAVHLLDEMPIAMAHGMFPRHQEKLRPTTSQYWYSADIRKAASQNLFRRMFGSMRGSGTSGLTELFIPVRYSYVIDLSVNTTSKEIPMGEPGTSWFYTVPAKGSNIPAGKDANGTPIYRIADENDARLYPRRRLIISSESCIMYDGPAFDWHGRLPLIPFCVDDWPWEPLGFSLVRDGYEIQCAIQELERGVMDKHRAQLDMPLAYDINSVTKKEAQQFDPMQPRSRIGFDGMNIDKPFVSPIPPEVLKVEQSTMQFIEHLSNSMDHQLAIKDIMSLAKARAIGTNENAAEKILEVGGPIIEDISRSMEPSMRELGEQVKYLVLQHYNTARVMQYVGPDSVTKETFDFHPDSLVPSHLPGEDPNKESASDRTTRARTMADNARFLIMPNSLHEITQMAMKLLMLQLKRSGFPIDSATVAEALNIPNFGNPFEGSTVYERWQDEQEKNIEFMSRIKELADALQSAGINLGQAGPPGAAGAGPHGGGRPPSGQKAPQLASKDGGTRSTVKES